MENELLVMEKDKEAAKISFEKEVFSFEFTEIINDMDLSTNVNQSERDKYLKKHGKKLFKEHPIHKKSKIRLFFKKLCLWKLDIKLKYLEYKYGPTMEKDDFSQDRMKGFLSAFGGEVPSQEEIDKLLTAINETDNH